MTKSDFQSRHQIVRNAIKEDIFFFAIPAIIIFFIGLIVCSRDGYEGLTETIWRLIWQPQDIHLLSIPQITGLLVFVSGLSLALVAHGTLKHFYSSTLVIKEDHQLITHGVYRIVRHPIYLGTLIAIMGAPIYASSLYGFLILLGLIPIVLNRIRMEERLLLEEFGDEYRVYCESTKKLIPFLY